MFPLSNVWLCRPGQDWMKVNDKEGCCSSFLFSFEKKSGTISPSWSLSYKIDLVFRNAKIMDISSIQIELEYFYAQNGTFIP